MADITIENGTRLYDNPRPVGVEKTGSLLPISTDFNEGERIKASVNLPPSLEVKQIPWVPARKPIKRSGFRYGSTTFYKGK